LLASVPLAGASFSNGNIYYEWQIDHALGPFHGGPDTELLEIFISSLRSRGALRTCSLTPPQPAAFTVPNSALGFVLTIGHVVRGEVRSPRPRPHLTLTLDPPDTLAGSVVEPLHAVDPRRCLLASRVD